MEKKYLRIEDVAEQYSIGIRDLRVMCRQQTVRASKVGKRWFIAPQDIERVFQKGVMRGGKPTISK